MYTVQMHVLNYLISWEYAANYYVVIKETSID